MVVAGPVERVVAKMGREPLRTWLVDTPRRISTPPDVVHLQKIYPRAALNIGLPSSWHGTGLEMCPCFWTLLTGPLNACPVTIRALWVEPEG